MDRRAQDMGPIGAHEGGDLYIRSIMEFEAYSAILICWARAQGARPTWKEWRGSALIGVLILTCGAGAGTYGQLTVPSGLRGVLSALLPLIAAIMGYVLFREKLPVRGIMGLVIGFAGIGLLLRPGSGLDFFRRCDHRDGTNCLGGRRRIRTPRRPAGKTQARCRP